jgi:hypothetical protein
MLHAMRAKFGEGDLVAAAALAKDAAPLRPSPVGRHGTKRCGRRDRHHCHIPVGFGGERLISDAVARRSMPNASTG